MEVLEQIRNCNPSNLLCCDCSQKSSNNINLTIGSFVCLKCATLLQSLQHRVKSQWDQFSEAELQICRKANNLQVNQRYLAKYDRRYQAALPTPHTDEITMKRFLEQKYIQRCWENTVFMNQQPPSMRRTKSNYTGKNTSQRQLFRHATETTGQRVPSSKPTTTTKANTFQQENFADFSVFNERTRSDSTGHNHSGSSLDSRNNSSTEGKSFDELECIANAMPQPSSKYESIAKLDEEMRRTHSETSPHTPPIMKSQQQLKQRTKSVDASAFFLQAQFGSPTSTGHALFGVLPSNSPIRAQLAALQAQQAQQLNTNNPFLELAQGSASTPISRSITPTGHQQHRFSLAGAHTPTRTHGLAIATTKSTSTNPFL